uniref:Olfactory receptor 107 n=1 Tax=Aulacocentrum confusum TaxID=2767324 RepID=A0A7G8Z9C6_9HYME|nr:olfactory receptor 107 [Aulacocentrum confusum]
MIYMHLFHIYPVKYGYVLPGVYPWKTTANGLFYKIQIILEMIAMIMTFCTTIGVDLLFSLYIMLVISQLIEMSHRISELGTKEKNYEVIKKTMMQHEVLINCFHDINNIFGPMILWGKIFNAGTICSAMYQIYKVSIMNIKWISRLISPIIINITKIFTASQDNSTVYGNPCYFYHLQTFPNICMCICWVTID